MKKILIAIIFTCILSADEIMVFAAASLKFVMDDIKKEFLKNNPNDKINISYLASGKAYNQIINGARAHLFIAADTEYPSKLKQTPYAGGEVVNYAEGKLVLFSLKNGVDIQKISDLDNPKISSIALPNPKLAPYGKAGMEALKASNLWEKIENKIVYGESIGQTNAFVRSGNSDVGFNALSMVINDSNEVKYYIIPDTMYSRILQSMILTSNGKDSALAKKFSEFILSPEANKIFEHYGYAKP